MSEHYILALDQGTTSSRAVLVGSRAETKAISQKSFTQIYPRPGWVEHDPLELWDSQLESARAVLAEAGVSPSQIAAIGLTNQRETVLLWDRHTGLPLHSAIVWQCRRTAAACDAYAEHAGLIRERTGLVVDAYFSATKIHWLLDHVKGAREAARAGRVAAGTVDSWLVWQLTGGRRHVTDASNASRTMLFNIHTMKWDEELLELFDIPASVLPEVVESSGVLAESAQEIFGRSIPIAGLAGDQQAALFGQCCFEAGQAKNTYGTGCFVLMNTGSRPVVSENRMLTTVAWRIGGQTTYALEGSVFIAGAAIDWLRDGLQVINSASETAELAQSVEDTAGVYVVPAFVGLGAPYWDPYARGAILGLTRGTTRAHVVRATLESIAYQTRDLLEAIQADAGVRLTELRVDGGVARNDFLLQFQADILGCALLRPAQTESTAMGAAYLAGLSCGFWQGTEELQALNEASSAHFKPWIEPQVREALYKKWLKAVKRVARWGIDE